MLEENEKNKTVVGVVSHGIMIKVPDFGLQSKQVQIPITSGWYAINKQKRNQTIP